MSSNPPATTIAGAARRLDPRWLRAAVLGSLWAASEIVLGSFLHNLGVPLRGHMLTAIAVALLVAGHRTWRQPGLLWRAGLIAAVMKSVSPSAVLLGPMLAIAMEGLAMELGVRLLAGRLAGYLVGGVLAMSWTLFHKLAFLVVVYGEGIITLYRELIAHAERQLGPVPLGPWGPLLVLAAVNVVVGAAAALVGWTVVGRQPADAPGAAVRPSATPRRRLPPDFRHSPTLLAGVICVLPAGMLAISTLPLAVAASLVVLFVTASWWRYRSALRPLARPGFWLALLAVTVAGGVLLQGASGLPGPWGGVLVGLRMSLRAVFVTVCFALLGSELANPRIRDWLGRRGGASLVAAVEAAFATLPAVIAALPPAHQLLARPRSALANLLPSLEGWLADLSQRPSHPAAIHLVTGSPGTGKSTLVGEAVALLGDSGISVAGIWAPARLRRKRRIGFDVVDLATGVRRPFCRRKGDASWPGLCEYRVNPAGLAHGRRALGAAATGGHDLVVVDEVGPWELAGDGWASALDALRKTGAPLLLVVRATLVEQVSERWCLVNPQVWQADATTPAELATAIQESLGLASAAAVHG